MPTVEVEPDGDPTRGATIATRLGPTVTTLAGNGGRIDGSGAVAQFNTPWGMAFDGQGNLYVADWGNNCIRKITPAGDVTTLAGNGAGGWADGTGGLEGTAKFDRPSAVAVDSQSNVYVADTSNNRIRKIAPDGRVTTLAGNGNRGWRDGTGGPDGTAEFNQPYGVAVDAAGNVYASDTFNNRIRKIDQRGNVTTLAGNGTVIVEGACITSWADGTGGPNGSAEFSCPWGIAVDAQGNLYVADAGNNRLRKVSSDGAVSTLSGNGMGIGMDGSGGPNGSADLSSPADLAVDSQGNVFVVDAIGIRKATPTGDITTVARAAVSGTTAAWVPVGIAVAANDHLYVDAEDPPEIRNAIEEIGTYGVHRILAGTGSHCYDGTGGPRGTAEFFHPYGLDIDRDGNVYVADTDNNRIRRVDRTGNVSTLAGNGSAGWADGTGGPNGTAEFNRPTSVALDRAGRVYVADGDGCLRKIAADGFVTTLPGCMHSPSAGGTGNVPLPLTADSIAFDAWGDLYISDTQGERILKLDASGTMTTLAGTGTYGWKDGPGGSNGVAEFFGPAGLAIDMTGNIYVADIGNNRIRKIDPDGTVTTVAGNGVAGSVDGTGGANGTAEFNCPRGVAVDIEGNIYVAEISGDRIRRIDKAGNVTTVAGTGEWNWADGLASMAKFFAPSDIQIGPHGELYVADAGDSRIRRIDW